MYTMQALLQVVLLILTSAFRFVPYLLSLFCGKKGTPKSRLKTMTPRFDGSSDGAVVPL
jgi:hypothetical protein